MLTTAADALGLAVEPALAAAGFRILGRNVTDMNAVQETRLELAVQWRSRGRATEPPDFLLDLARRDEVRQLEWRGLELER